MRIQSLWTQRIWADGKHNGFPGIARFGDGYYVCFRRSAGHQSPRASIAVIRSAAGGLEDWREVAEFDVDGDSRDPFVAVVANRLHVYWHRNPDDWVSVSGDGASWSAPRAVETEFPRLPEGCELKFRSERRWHFRIRPGPDGCYYSLARCGIAVNAEAGLLLYRSKDGLSWEATHSFGEGIQRSVTAGHEADLAFMDSGVAVAAIRVSIGPGGQGMIASAEPPYRTWDCYWTGVRNFGGPALWKTAAGLMLAARHNPAHGGPHGTIWEVTPSGLSAPYVVPSAGDCAYQVFEDGADGEVLLCYYSMHERPWNRSPGTEQPADLYLAHIRAVPGLVPGF